VQEIIAVRHCFSEKAKVALVYLKLLNIKSLTNVIKTLKGSFKRLIVETVYY
jgi:hypothetical protein